MNLEYSAYGGWRIGMNEVKELATALAKAQGIVENAKKQNVNPHFKSKYADLATIWDVIREPLTSNGLSVVQLPCEAPEGKVGLVTHILHSSGQVLSERFFCGLKDSSNPQNVGSCLTYMKRYALLGVAGIASEDDDGNAATGKPGPVAAVVDYTETIHETMGHLARATDVEARALYATVRNSGMQQPAKDDLLRRMADFIQVNMKNAQNADSNTSKGKK